MNSKSPIFLLVSLFSVTLMFSSCEKDEPTTSEEEYTDSRDGQVYQTVMIDGKVWFAENLNYQMTSGLCYDNNTNNCEDYGRLYTWNEALAACPPGWHLPTDAEWAQFEIAMGMNQFEATDSIGWRGTNQGEKMKSTTGWYSGGNGTNDVGFNGLAGGILEPGSGFLYLGKNGVWWTASDSGGGLAWCRALIWNQDKVARFGYGKDFSFSVRCVKD